MMKQKTMWAQTFHTVGFVDRARKVWEVLRKAAMVKIDLDFTKYKDKLALALMTIEGY